MTVASPMDVGRNDLGRSHPVFCTIKESVQRLNQAIENGLRFAALKQVPIVILLIAALRWLFVVTYPPNLHGDAVNYYQMIREWSSNLIHAGGYPCLMGILMWVPVVLLAWRLGQKLHRFRCESTNFRFWASIIPLTLAVVASRIVWLRLPGEERYFIFDVFLQYYIVGLQNLIFVLGIWFAFATLSMLFRPAVANAIVLLYALNPRTLGFASCMYPEWLQGTLLVAFLCCLYRAYCADIFVDKRFWYALAAASFCWCVLVKPNALVAGVVLPFVFCFERVPWRARLACLACGLAIFLINYAAFLLLFHRPSTGTYMFTHDKAWVLLDKVSFFVPDHKLDPQAGINTKRLIYLNSVLPRGPETNLCVHAVRHVNTVPLDVREPYRSKYLYVLNADEATLDRLIAESHPATTFDDFYYAWHPTFAYIGMPEGDALGTKVYVEHVWAHLGRFTQQIAVEMLRMFWDKVEPSYLLWQKNVPSRDTRPNGDLSYLIDLSTIAHESTWGGFVRLHTDGAPVHMKPNRVHYWLPGGSPGGACAYTVPVVWKPGTHLFAAWKDLGDLVYHRRFVTIIIGLGLLACIAQLFATRRMDSPSVVLLVLCTMVLAFYIFSMMVLLVRWKESLPLLLPVCVIFVAATIQLLSATQRLLAIFPRSAQGSLSSGRI